MAITRREFTIGAAAAVGAAAFSFPRPAIAQSEPIRLGWLAAMTGPSSAPAIGFNRATIWAAEAINSAGGVKGRKIEILTRDTQGDLDEMDMPAGTVSVRAVRRVRPAADIVEDFIAGAHEAIERGDRDDPSIDDD